MVFAGVVDQSGLVTSIRDADIFVMLSENQPTGEVEGFGIAILEANSRRVPAIGSSGCGIEQAISEGYSGWLVNPHDVSGFVNAVDRIMANL